MPVLKTQDSLKCFSKKPTHKYKATSRSTVLPSYFAAKVVAYKHQIKSAISNKGKNNHAKSSDAADL